MAQSQEAPMTAAQIADQLAGWRRQLIDQQAKLDEAAEIAVTLQSEHDALLVAARIDKDAAAVRRLADLTSRQFAAQEEALSAEVILAQIQRHIGNLERNLFDVSGTAIAVAS